MKYREDLHVGDCYSVSMSIRVFTRGNIDTDFSLGVCPLLYLLAASVVGGCVGWPSGLHRDEECRCGVEDGMEADREEENRTPREATPYPATCLATVGWDMAELPDAGDAGEPVLLDHRRIVAVGDLHGTLDAAEAILEEAGLIDEENRWRGGNAILVQVGDEVDRGPSDREVIDFFEALRREAPLYGGAVVPLIGNHEIMNTQWNFNYVSSGGHAGFSDLPYNEEDPALAELDEEARGRAQAFRPGGPYAQILATRPVALKIAGTLFAHAGVTTDLEDDQDLVALNQKLSTWFRGLGPFPEEVDGPTWNRIFGRTDAEDVDCAYLEEVLRDHCAERMVVAHTIQEQVNDACDGRLIRIDVGMYQGERLGALEIIGDQVRYIDVKWTADNEDPL